MRTRLKSITPEYVKGLTYDEIKALDRELFERIGEIERYAAKRIEGIFKIRRILNDEAFEKALEEGGEGE